MIQSPKEYQEKYISRGSEESIVFLQGVLEKKEQELEYIKRKGKLIARELDQFRQRRTIQWADNLRNRFNAWNLMSSCFQQLKDDCMLFHDDINDFVLQPSKTLNRIPFLDYKIRLDRYDLSGIMLAVILDFPSAAGEIGIQIASANGMILAETELPLTSIVDDKPTLFQFSPIKECDNKPLLMKVFVRNADSPIRLFELRRYTWYGLGPTEIRAFCGFNFD